MEFEIGEKLRRQVHLPGLEAVGIFTGQGRQSGIQTLRINIYSLKHKLLYFIRYNKYQ